MYAQGIDNLCRQRLVRSFRECTVDNVFQLLAGIHNTTNGHITLKQTVGFDCRPIVIKRDDTRCILRNICVKDTFDGHGDVLQNVTVFYQINFIEYINVRRMNREQVHELLQSGRHAGIEAAEFFEVLVDHGLLLRCLLQNTLGHNIRSCLLSNNELSKTVTNMLQCIGYEAETRIVKNLLLHTEYNTQFGFGTHFTERTEEFKVKDDFSLVTRRQVRQELVDDNQIALVRVFFGEGHHHILNNGLQALYAVVVRNFKINATVIKVILNIAHDDIIQRHNDAADFNTQNFKLACDRLHLFCKLLILQILQVISVCCDSGDNRHQVRFTGTIVTDNQHTFIVYYFVHLQLVNQRSL